MVIFVFALPCGAAVLRAREPWRRDSGQYAETRKGKQPRARKNEPVPPEKPGTIKAKPPTGNKAAGKSERKSKPRKVKKFEGLKMQAIMGPSA
jgi:hypothetical protein